MTAKPPGTPSAGAYPRLTELPDPPKPPDAMQQRKHIASADQALRSHFRHLPDVPVSGDGYLCYDASDVLRTPGPTASSLLAWLFRRRSLRMRPTAIPAAKLGGLPILCWEVASKAPGDGIAPPSGTATPVTA